MRGYITEANFDECEEAFPGIVDFYRRLIKKPGTFLELVREFLSHAADCASHEGELLAA
jgi:hypothetical protein